MAGDAVAHHLRPDDVAVALDDGVRAAMFPRFVRKERRVDAAVDHPCAALARLASHFVSAQRVAGMNADADHVSGLDVLDLEGRQRFVDEVGITPLASRRRGENVEPAGSDHGHAKGHVARID